MGIKKLAKNIIILSIPKSMKFLSGIVKDKIIAITLGPSGSGIINQIQINLMNIANLSTAGMGDGAVKLISQSRSENDYNKVRSIIFTYFITILFSSIFVYLLGFIFYEKLTILIFGDIIYSNYFLITFISLPIIILNSVSYVILKSFKEIKYLAITETIITLVSLLSFLVLIFLLEEKGMILNLTITYCFTFLIYQYYSRYKVLNKYNIYLGNFSFSLFEKKHLNILLKFAGVGGTLIIISTFTEIYTRYILVSNIGLNNLGIYVPIYKWEALFSGFILPALTTYTFPLFSETKTNEKINIILNDVFRIMSFLSFFFIMLVIATRKIFIPIFYSIEYYESVKYIPFHFFGLMFIIWYKCFKQAYAPTGKLKQLFLIEIFNYIFVIFLIVIFVPKIGLWGWVMRYTLVPFILFIIYMGYLNKKINFKLSASNKILFLYIIISLLFIITGITFNLSDLFIYFLTVFFLLILFLLLNKQEKKYLLNKLYFK